MARNGKHRDRTRTASPRSPVKTSYVILVAVVLLIVIAAGLYIVTARKSPAPSTASTSSSTPAQTETVHPYTTRHIYSESADPAAEIAAALKLAQQQHKRVLLDFGGDWCGDCQVLDIYFHQPPNAQILDQNFILTHVWIGRMDHNLEIAAKYGVPISKGVPALAVLDASGKVIESQRTGEFKDMRSMDLTSVTDFLNRWKA